MVDLLESRVRKLTDMSEHCRRLAAELFPENASAEIASVADQFDDEVGRINRDCIGRRTCPCEFAATCVAVELSRLRGLP
jgi:hypothetical protein